MILDSNVYCCSSSRSVGYCMAKWPLRLTIPTYHCTYYMLVAYYYHVLRPLGMHVEPNVAIHDAISNVFDV